MTSKQQYHERKAAGLCTKCSAPLDNSPSLTRCIPCYEKFKASKKQIKENRLEKKLCLTCSEPLTKEFSNYCQKCRDKNTLQKRQNLESQETIIYKPENTQCRVCNGIINTLGALCKNCYSSSTFSKKDAVTRYGNKCQSCEETDLDKLRLVSIDISQPMKLRSLELYRTVCFSKNLLPDYKISCHSCYWKECFNYTNSYKTILQSQYQKDDDSIEIDYEVINEDSDDAI